jgi:hypothetical protein
MEAVAQIARHIASSMPLAASVEEAAIVMMSALPGLSTEAALSLARIKRTREALSRGLRAGAMARSRGSRGSRRVGPGRGKCVGGFA